MQIRLKHKKYKCFSLKVAEDFYLFTIDNKLQLLHFKLLHVGVFFVAKSSKFIKITPGPEVGGNHMCGEIDKICSHQFKTPKNSVYK